MSITHTILDMISVPSTTKFDINVQFSSFHFYIYKFNNVSRHETIIIISTSSFPMLENGSSWAVPMDGAETIIIISTNYQELQEFTIPVFR